MKSTANLFEIILPLKRVTLSALPLLGVVLTATYTYGQSTYTPYTFTTFAGSACYGSADGTGCAARFALPCSVAADSAGNVYVADAANHTIRKVTPTGLVTTLAGLAGCPGTTDGTGRAARFYGPNGVAVDSAGNVYVADTSNHTLRQVTPAGVVTTLAGLAGSAGTNDGTGSAARFNGPGAVAVDSAGNVYVADTANHTLRQVTPAGVVTTLAGLAGSAGSANGTGSAARFCYPWGMTADTNGNVYVADAGNCTIRKVTLAGVVTTLAGLAGNTGTNDGTGSAARFCYPCCVAVDANGNLYVADTYNHMVRKVTSARMVTTLAGLAGNAGTNDGTGSAARFYYPYGVAVDTNGTVYVADTDNETIRKVTPVGASWVVTTLAGLAADSAGSADGTRSAARFYSPRGIAADTDGNVYVTDTDNHTIRQVSPVGLVTTLAGLVGHAGSADGTNSAARFNAPEGVAVDTEGNLYVNDSRNNTIRKMTPVGTNWVVTTLAGLAGSAGSTDGTNRAARFNFPLGVAVDTNGNVYVADSSSATLRRVAPVGTNWVVTTLAGLAGSAGSADGTGSAARFDRPNKVAVDSAGNVYVADVGNFTIRKVTPVGTNWVVTTLAGLAGNAGSADGTGSAARFYYPNGLAVDSAGNVYVGDSSNGLIRKVTPGGVVTTLAGLAGHASATDGTGSAARFDVPAGVAVDSAGNVYVADARNNTIRKGFPASSVPAPILLTPSLSAGQFGFGITGLPGLPVYLESAGDLSQWQVVGTCILEGGTNYCVSPDPPLGAQFYRAHVR